MVDRAGREATTTCHVSGATSFPRRTYWVEHKPNKLDTFILYLSINSPALTDKSIIHFRPSQKKVIKIMASPLFAML